jgi:hypothetical protein
LVVSWLKWLFADFSLQRTGFSPTEIDIGFVVNRVALWYAFPIVVRLHLPNIIPSNVPFFYPSSGDGTMDPFEAHISTDSV